MKIFNRVLERWRSGRSSHADQTNAAEPTPGPGAGDAHLAGARDVLTDLLDDPNVPEGLRRELEPEFGEVRRLLEKIEHAQVHIAVFGRVSVGKSALLNALLGQARFSVSALHGETRSAGYASWTEVRDGAVVLIDTPGINEVGGEAREALAREVAGRSDLVMFVIDGDLTDTEFRALKSIVEQARPVLVVLNKIDHYPGEERLALRAAVVDRLRPLVRPEDVIEAAAHPAPRVYVERDAQGIARESTRRPAASMDALRERLWEILERDGKSLAALNASLFAGELSDRVARRIVEVRREAGDRIINGWALGKGVAVALNPVPVADLVAAAVADGSLVVHLSRLYGLPMTRGEAGTLVRTIAAQMAVLMGASWVVHLVASLLKAGTGGLSTVLTAGAQGAVAYYTTTVVGRAAQRYLADGRSWGEGGAKQVVRRILDETDRDALIADARKRILGKL